MIPSAVWARDGVLRRALLSTCALATAGCAACLALAMKGRADAPGQEARLLLSDNVRDVGTTDVREVRLIPFLIRNSGTRRLVLSELDLECGCGHRVLRTLLVAPGDAATVSVPLDTRQVHGPVSHTAAFTTNDPAQPRLELVVRANVLADRSVLAQRPRSE